MNEFLIKNNEWISFLLKEIWNWIFEPVNKDESYSLFFDILKSNWINYVVWIKNEYFLENAFFKDDIKNVIFMLNNTLNINNQFLQNKYFINDSKIQSIALNINFEFLKKKEIVEDEDFMYSVIFFDVENNNVSFNDFNIYSIESDMEIDTDDFLIFNSYTTPITNKKELINTLFKMIFNEDYYVDMIYFENKMKEYWYYEYFTAIIENSVYQPITKKKYDNMFSTSDDLFIVNEITDNISISDLNIKENLWYFPAEIFDYFGSELNSKIKDSEYYIYTIYLWYLIININKYIEENNNINLQTILFLMNKRNNNIQVMNNLLYPLFEWYIKKIENVDDWKIIFDKYINTLLSKIL